MKNSYRSLREAARRGTVPKTGPGASGEETQMAHPFLSLLVIKELQIKTTYCLSPTGLANFKMSDSNQDWPECGEAGSLSRS